MKLAFQNKVTREEAEEAARTLIKWAGDDPKREGLIDTPKTESQMHIKSFSQAIMSQP